VPAPSAKPEWQLHQEHDETITRILTETGCLDEQRRLRRWLGRVVVPRIEAAGHTSTYFYDCHCRTASTTPLAPRPRTR
jgi:hypothetical protein